VRLATWSAHCQQDHGDQRDAAADKIDGRRARTFQAGNEQRQHEPHPRERDERGGGSR
jgi:hypothetical protein